MILNLMNNHGLASSKNTFFFNNKTIFKSDHTDGLIQVSQESKVLITVQLEEMSLLEDQLRMLIINVVFMLELKFQEQTPKSSQVSGNSKLDHASESSKEINYGQQDIFYKDVQRNTILG